MTKTVAILTATLMVAALLSACSGFQESAAEPINYHGSGDVVEYHSNGKIKRKAEYLNGELVSVVDFYPSGTEKSREHYTMGELQDATYYFASGRVKTRITGK